jgi:diguanylate cyclase (GGDEF)-like protein
VRSGFLALASLQWISQGIAVLSLHGEAPGLKLGVAGAMLAVWVWWLAGWRRGRFPRFAEPLEWAVAAGPVLLALQAGSVGVGAVFAVLFARGLYGSRPDAVLRVLYSATLACVGSFAGPDSAGRDHTVIGVAAIIPFFLYLLTRLLAQHDGLAGREAALRAGAEALSATLQRARIYDIATGVAFELVGRAEHTTVLLGTLEGKLARIVSAAGEDATVLHGGGYTRGSLTRENRAALDRGDVLQYSAGNGPLTNYEPFDNRPHGLVLPLRIGGRRVGALHVASDLPVPPETQASLTTWTTALAGSLESVALHEELTRRAFHDPLTELPNRALMDRRLTEALTRCPPGQKAALLLIDLDKFKPVNDQFGHQAGDELLQLVAARLRGCVREGDSAGRIGGDEFAVVLPGLDDPALATDVAQRVVDALEAPFQLKEHTVTIGASVGIALADPGDADSLALTRAADVAMYEAKASRTNGWVVYDPALHAVA